MGWKKKYLCSIFDIQIGLYTNNMSERPALTLRRDFSILLIFLLHINGYTPENSSNSVSPGKKREWIYLQSLSEKRRGVAEARLPSSLSLLERMCVFKCELWFYILGKELSIANKKLSGQDPLLPSKLSHPPRTTVGYRVISVTGQHSITGGKLSLQPRILSECRGTQDQNEICIYKEGDIVGPRGQSKTH